MINNTPTESTKLWADPLRLSAALGVDERFSINIQTDYDLEIERDRLGDDLAKIPTLAAG